MTTLDNRHICPEDIIRVLLPAYMIPHDAQVTKRNGDVEYTLKHALTVYGIDSKAVPREPPLTVDGFFVVGKLGSINQVDKDVLLHWHVTAEDFVQIMGTSWQGPSQ